MSEKPSCNALAFASAGAAILAWRWAPAGTSPSELMYGYIASGTFGTASVVLAVQALHAAESRPSPWPTLAGRIAWALRPRSWMLAWAAILITAAVVGTPHLAYEYPPRACTYVGWNGVVKHRGSDCPWWKWL